MTLSEKVIWGCRGRSSRGLQKTAELVVSLFVCVVCNIIGLI